MHHELALTIGYTEQCYCQTGMLHHVEKHFGWQLVSLVSINMYINLHLTLAWDMESLYAECKHLELVLQSETLQTPAGYTCLSVTLTIFLFVLVFTTVSAHWNVQSSDSYVFLWIKFIFIPLMFFVCWESLLFTKNISKTISKNSLYPHSIGNYLNMNSYLF